MDEAEVFDSEVYPIDPHKLVKGTDIDPVPLMRVKCQPNTDQYRLECLRLIQEIRRASDREKLNLSLCIRGERIHVNSDVEAMAYHNDAAKARIRGLKRDAIDMAFRVNTANLSDTEKDAHHRNRARVALQLQSIKESSASLRKIAPSDPIPKIPRRLS